MLHHAVAASLPPDSQFAVVNAGPRRVLAHENVRVNTPRLSQFRSYQPQNSPAFGSSVDFLLTDTNFACSQALLRFDLSALSGAGAAVNQVQRITISALLTSGTFALRFRGHTTAPLAFNASTAAIKAAIEALGSFVDIDGQAGNNATVTVSATFSAATSVDFTFGGALAGQPVTDFIEFVPISNAVSATYSLPTAGVSAVGTNLAVYRAICRAMSADMLVNRIEIYGSGGSQLLQTIYGAQLFLLHEMLLSGEKERQFYEQAYPARNQAASVVYIDLLGSIFNMPSALPLYLSGSALRITVYLSDLASSIYTSFSTLTSPTLSINSLQLWLRLEEQDHERRALIGASRSMPVMYRYIDYKRCIAAYPPGVTTATVTLTGLVGAYAALFIMVRQANAQGRYQRENFEKLASLEVRSASGQTISQLLPANLVQNRMRELLPGSLWHKHHSLERPEQAKNIYMIPFAADPASALLYGVNSGDVTFSGQETLTINYASPPATPTEVYILAAEYVYLSCQSGTFAKLE